MTALLGQTLAPRRINASTKPMRYVIQDAGWTAKLRTRAMIATDSLNTKRSRLEAWKAARASPIASVGRVPASTGLRLKPIVWQSRWLARTPMRIRRVLIGGAAGAGVLVMSGTVAPIRNVFAPCWLGQIGLGSG